MATKVREISNSDDIIDSRDVIARIDYLASDCEDYNPDSDSERPDEYDEYKALKALAEEAEGYCPDWTYGAALIRDSHFEDYAQELAEDCGMVTAGASWPNNCIDWEEAARQLKQDYTSVDFDGVEYWVR